MSSYTVDNLLDAIEENNIENVKVLLNKGVDVNSTDSIGWNPLLLAYHKENLELMELLLDNGADTEIKLKQNGFSILADALFNYKDDIVKLLVKKGANVNVKYGNINPILYIRMSNDDLEIFNLFIASGFDLTARGINNETSLMSACSSWRSSLPIVKKILELHPELLHMKNDDNTNALMYACKSADNIEIVKFLIDQGIDIHLTNKKNRSALSYAVSSGFFEAVNLLIEKGVDTNIKDIWDRTLLDISKEGYDDPRIKDLLFSKSIL
jgi:ankyrin repeat protein